MRHDLPTPPEIADVPELALLSVLDFALEACVRALVAAHPELEELTPPPSATPEARSAHRLLAHAFKLRLLLATYRDLATGDSTFDSPPGEDAASW